MFGLVDCNNFYCSCERVFNPVLRTRPVVVLSNNDGCIIARSNEAKALGIAMGAPFYQAKAIVDYRRKHGRLKNLKPFVLYEEFDPEALERIGHYVCFGE